MKYSACVLTTTGFDTILQDASYYECKLAIKFFNKVKYEQEHPGILVEGFDIVPDGGHSMLE
jgi:hypothetical protein